MAGRSNAAVVCSTETEKQERAFTLGLAGLLGEGVYNFGELVGFNTVMLFISAVELLLTIAVVFLQLMHPVLETLRNTDKQWLIDTLYAFNGGNVEKFQSFKSAWGQQVISIIITAQPIHLGSSTQIDVNLAFK